MISSYRAYLPVYDEKNDTDTSPLGYGYDGCSTEDPLGYYSL